MSFKNIKQGFYKIKNPEKFIKPIDEHMKSFNESTYSIQYKSSLELKAFKYADLNSNVQKFSIEPFPIYYISPKDNKQHRYYIDLFLELKSGDKILVEIKPESQIKPPKAPKVQTNKAIKRYQMALLTYAINIVKWEAAKEFALKNNMQFTILTDRVLN